MNPINMRTLSEFNINTYNVNGIGQKKKRQLLFTMLDNIHADITALIDTRLRADKEIRARSETDNYHFHSLLGKDGARGITVLISKKLPFRVTATHKDTVNHNFLMITGELYNKKILICAVYGPNTDDHRFHQLIMDTANNFQVDHRIILGDFNITLNPGIDTHNYTNPERNNPRARETVNQLIEQHNLHDHMREINGNKNLWSWLQWDLSKRARLDYILTSHTTQAYIKGSSFIERNDAISDHRLVRMVIDFDRFSPGKGPYTIPHHLLSKEDFRVRVRSTLREVAFRYYMPDEEHNHLRLVNPTRNFFETATDEEKAQFFAIPWDTLWNLPFKRNAKTIMEEAILASRGTAMQYSFERKTQIEKDIDELRRTLCDIEAADILNLGTLNDINSQIRDKMKLLKTEKYLHKDIEWAKAGERITPTLCNLGKDKAAQRFIPSLIITDANGQQKETSNQTEIDESVAAFWKELYDYHELDLDRSKKIEDFIPQGHQQEKIKPETADKCDLPLSMKELTDALNKTDGKTSPGSDGLGYAFYKVFWREMRTLVLNSMNKSLRSRLLPTSQRLGLISMIPKGTKDRRFLQHWRPICLLNCWYKLLSSALATRLEAALQEVISKDQTGFLRSRFINENNLITHEVLEYSKKHRKRGLLLCIDFSKAFDTLDHQFIKDTLKYLGFGNRFIAFIGATLNEFCASILHAGNMSPQFPLRRGARQGDPLASLLFIACVEILSIRLKGDPLLKHYKLDEVIIKLILYADDLNLFLQYCAESLRQAIKILNEFTKLSGLKVQVTKTQVVLLGDVYTPQHKLCSNLNLRWDQTFKLLGITFNAAANTHSINYEDKIKQIMDEMVHWRTRFLSPIGRKNVVCSLFLSKMTHIATVLPVLPAKDIAKLERDVYDFIWAGFPKLNRPEAKMALEHGGLQTPDIKMQWAGNKIGWNRRLDLNPDTKWAEIIQHKIHRVAPHLNIRNITQWSSASLNMLIKDVDSSIWKEIFRGLKDFILADIKADKHKILTHNAWGMSMLKTAAGRPMRLDQVRDLEAQGILPAKLVCINNGALQTRDVDEVIESLPGIRPNQIRNAINSLDRLLPELNTTDAAPHLNPDAPTLIHAALHRHRKGSSHWTKTLRQNPTVIEKIKTKQRRWITVIGPQTDAFWKQQYLATHKIKFDNKIMLLHLQSIKRTLRTNIFVSKFVPEITSNCTFCNQHRETIEHLLHSCQHTQDFIERVNDELPLWTRNQPLAGPKDTIFLDDRFKDIYERDLLKLMIKDFIWKNRCLHTPENLTIANFKEYSQKLLTIHHQANTIPCLANRDLRAELEI